MARKNFREDLDFRVILRDGKEQELPLPWYDFRLVLRTDGCHAFTAWRKGEHWENCFADNGRIHVVMNGHGLGPGVLRMEMIADIPNGIYPDGAQLTVMPEETCIELVVGKSDWPDSVEVELTLSALSDDLCRILDEVNAQLERTLGGPIVLRQQARASSGGEAPDPAPVKAKAPYSLAEYVSRGKMPKEARPGVVYRNHDPDVSGINNNDFPYITISKDGEVVGLKGPFPVRRLTEPSRGEMEEFISKVSFLSKADAEKIGVKYLGRNGYYRYNGINYEVQRRMRYKQIVPDPVRSGEMRERTVRKWSHVDGVPRTGVIRIRRVPGCVCVHKNGIITTRSKASATEWRYYTVVDGRYFKRI